MLQRHFPQEETAVRSAAARPIALVLLLAAHGAGRAAAAVSPLGADFALDPDVSCAASDPRLATLASGDLVAVWRDERGVWVRRFDAQGAPRSSDATQVASGYSIAFPRVAPLANGGFAIAWFDQASAQIVVRRADAAGQLGAAFDVLPAAAFTSFNASGLAVRAGAGDRLGVAFTVWGGATY